MDYTNLVPVIGIIVNITRGNDCCSQMLSLRTEDGIVNFFLSMDTIVIDSRQLRQGMRVAAFYDNTLPVPLIFPPQYQAQLITQLGRNEQVMLNYFDSDLTAADNTLQLNIAGGTLIRTLNGQNITCNLGDHTLLVYYTITTRSIPPQTTPRKIIVLCDET
ncbi:hypothetical protein FMM74_006830 [Lachnospiraceae bacterium MD308]|nr:hypothetical protein [Lachnospiraceae bacterium MD308]MCI8581276.1 hypothetical protein [Dorea sp.]